MGVLSSCAPVSTAWHLGVPFFTVLLGFGVGWFAARQRAEESLPQALRGCFRTGLLTSLASLVLLSALWLPWLPAAWGSQEALANTGVPLILYAARASFIGWMALMLMVSPLLQLLTTLSAS